MGKRVQLFDTFPLGDPAHVIRDARSEAIVRSSNAWRGRDAPPPSSRAVSDCACDRCSGKRDMIALDRMENATQGERYIGRFLAADRSSGPRDAYMARQSRAHDADARERDDKASKAGALDALDALDPRERYMAHQSAAYRR